MPRSASRWQGCRYYARLSGADRHHRRTQLRGTRRCPPPSEGESPHERPPGRPPGQHLWRRQALAGPPAADDGSPRTLVSAARPMKTPRICPIPGANRFARPFLRIAPPMRHGICSRCRPECETRYNRLRSWVASWEPWKRRAPPGLTNSRTPQTGLRPMRASMIRPRGSHPMQESTRCPT